VELKYQKSLAIVLIIFSVFVSDRCAQIGNISGGPKDVDPPLVVGSNPKNFATNFTGKKIKIDFNEYIVLKDISQQFNVSPPMKKKPVVSVS
jgi:hypothetical protein